ncbi:MAG: thiamine-phosphate kinase [Methylovirgula sp.]|jgi:thiamine-monophosphate kinase
MSRPSEDELIAAYFAPLAGPAGLGLSDDAALLYPPSGHELVISTDMLAAGVDFFADDPPDAIAKKALRVNLSDLAGKAAQPLGFLLSLALPADWTEPWLSRFASGLGEDAKAYSCPLIGGDTMKSPDGLILSITAIGTVGHGQMVPRGGVAEGDLLYVSGTIGDAALGLRLRRADEKDAGWIGALAPDARGHLAARYLLPQPRLDLSRALKNHAHAAMDISDGLAGDLAKMLRLTGLTADIAVENIPFSDAARQALALDPALIATILSGGDDYEILCAVAPAEAAAFEEVAGTAGVAVTRIAHARGGSESPVFRTIQGPVALPTLSYQHF